MRSDEHAALLSLHRCGGYRFNGEAVCNNGPVRGDQLERVVWDQVRALLKEPHRMSDEYAVALTKRVTARPCRTRSFISIGK